MIFKDITVAIFNYNGFRPPIINNKGRIETTIESLFTSCPEIKKMKVMLIDNDSIDGSRDYLKSINFGQLFNLEQIIKENSWRATTRNNMQNLKNVVKKVKTPFLWRIEDDSFFYNSNNFVKKALDVFKSDNTVDIIHLRKWTYMDAIDMPGVGRNLNRISQIKKTTEGDIYYIIEKLKEETIWIPLKEDLGANFIPDIQSGYGLCPLGEKEVGNVRINKKGEYERLLTEKWATYTNHGWICRTSCLHFAFENYNPLSEGDMASIFKKHFKAAKMNQDAFIAFGWRTRNSNCSEEETIKVFKEAKYNNYASCQDYGLFRCERPTNTCL